MGWVAGLGVLIVFQVFEAFTAAAGIYLLLSAVVTIGMRLIEKRLVIPGFSMGK